LYRLRNRGAALRVAEPHHRGRYRSPAAGRPGLRHLRGPLGMATIGFIGLGNMGAPMAANLVKAQHRVSGFDLVAKFVTELTEKGGHPAATADEAIADADIIVTMLPAGPQVRAVYLGPDGIIAHAKKGALLLDCSTIAVGTPPPVAAP